MNPIIIIGTGLAGYGVAREFRRLDAEAPLVLISKDDGDFYSKPMLSSALTQGKDAKSLVNTSAQKMAETLSARIIGQAQVTEIDTATQTLVANSEKLAFSKLVMAVGASPIRLPIPGEGAADILAVNNLEDYAGFREHLAGAKRVAIIGPGLIGSEFANDLLSAGKEVAVVGPDPWPISGLIPEPAGRALEQALAKAGVQWHLGTTTTSVDRAGDGYSIPLANGKTLEVDLVLSAVGLRPNTGLAQSAGMEVNRGIVADMTLRTSVPNVFAIGDCAEVGGRNLPYVAPLMAGSKALAKTLSGTPTEVVYPIMPVAIKTTLHPVVTLPPAEKDGEWVFETSETGVKGLHQTQAGVVDGFVLTGDRASEKQALVKELGAKG